MIEKSAFNTENKQYMYTRKVIIFGITLFLSSCGIYTKYQPQTSVPDNLYGEEAVGSDTTNMGCIHWRDFYRSLFAESDRKGLETEYRCANGRVACGRGEGIFTFC